MATEQEKKAREKTLTSLERIQNFDVNSLPRKNDLGSELNFSEAVEPAERLIGLYKQISTSSLSDLPEQHLNTITAQADSDYNRLDEVLNFSQKEANAYERRNAIIQAIENTYQTTFNKLHPLISYSTSKSADYKRLETEARSTIQSIKDQGSDIQKQLEQTQRQAQQILKETQKVAAEQGVSQQAVYFKVEAKSHMISSYIWLAITVILSIGLVITAVKFLDWNVEKGITSDDTYAIVQLTVSKLLVFATLSFGLGMSAKNYMANKHNEVINRHRENALKTYTALVKAAGDEANRDIVLNNAAECIFMAQATGFGKADNQDGKALSMLNIAPTALKHLSDG